MMRIERTSRSHVPLPRVRAPLPALCATIARRSCSSFSSVGWSAPVATRVHSTKRAAHCAGRSACVKAESSVGRLQISGICSSRSSLSRASGAAPNRVEPNWPPPPVRWSAAKSPIARCSLSLLASAPPRSSQRAQQHSKPKPASKSCCRSSRVRPLGAR
eukprot:3076494-Prymnesium_polylepis.3